MTLSKNELMKFKSYETVDKSHLLFDLTREIKQDFANSFTSKFNGLRKLVYIHDTKLYKLSYKTFDDYIKDEYPYAKRAKTYYEMAVVRVFGKTLEGRSPRELLSIPISRLKKCLPFIQNENDTQKWVDNAYLLNPRDFEDAVREAQGKVTSQECGHKWETLNRCRTCGLWQR